MVEELKPYAGHLPSNNAINLFHSIVDSSKVNVDEFIEYLNDNDIVWSSDSKDVMGVFNSITKGAPEAFYWLWKKYPYRQSNIKVIAKQGTYVMYMYRDGSLYNNFLVDEGADQIIGIIMSSPRPSLKEYFGRIPHQVNLSKVVPELRGGGDGKVMYSLFLQAYGSIISDSTLYEGSFAMWDTQIRQLAKYSGVLIESAEGLDIPLINKNDSVYDLPIINSLLGSFFASNTIAPWVIGFSKKLSTIDQKQAAYVSVTTSKYTPEQFYEVLDAIADADNPTTIVLGLSGGLRGKAKGRLGPEVNKFLRLVGEDWKGELWSSSGSYRKATHIIVLFQQPGSGGVKAVYDIDLSTEEPQVRIL